MVNKIKKLFNRVMKMGKFGQTFKMKLFLDSVAWIDTGSPLDLSIPLRNDELNPRAWYVEMPRFEPVRANGFVGSVKEGGSVNFRDIFFNPHGHGTHTECLGHITPEVFSINRTMDHFLCKALLISIEPERFVHPADNKEDHIIRLEQLQKYEPEEGTEAIVIRTLPNFSSKRTLNYSSTNPAYLDERCIEFFDKFNIRHLLIDTPSVDREEDGGKLAFHHAFWKVPEQPDFKRTITEMIFVSDKIEDGTYILDLQVASFENDAAPSRPVLYTINKG
jgi:arylformamidase